MLEIFKFEMVSDRSCSIRIKFSKRGDCLLSASISDYRSFGRARRRHSLNKSVLSQSYGPEGILVAYRAVQIQFRLN